MLTLHRHVTVFDVIWNMIHVIINSMAMVLDVYNIVIAPGCMV